jgi:hypothetical protein
MLAEVIRLWVPSTHPKDCTFPQKSLYISSPRRHDCDQLLKQRLRARTPRYFGVWQAKSVQEAPRTHFPRKTSVTPPVPPFSQTLVFLSLAASKSVQIRPAVGKGKTSKNHGLGGFSEEFDFVGLY